MICTRNEIVRTYNVLGINYTDELHNLLDQAEMSEGTHEFHCPLTGVYADIRHFDGNLYYIAADPMSNTEDQIDQFEQCLVADTNLIMV